MRLNTRTLTQNASIAATYAVLTLAIAPLAYSEIQFRLSEIMVFLAFYNKKWAWGLIVGCFIANMPSPLGMYDLLFGTLSTTIVVYGLVQLKNRYIASLYGAVITGLIIGFELHLAFGIPFVLNAIYVAVGELAVLFIGAIIFGLLEKNKRFMQFIKEG